MMHSAQRPQCRVAQVLRYFGETPANPSCGTCDVCRERGAS
jgi:superfamily II DNA helicase RecQ